MTKSAPILSVLAFRRGDPIDVLLIEASDHSGWGLPTGSLHKGLGMHASAALQASQQIGVSGRVFKRALRLAGEHSSRIVFPLLVRHPIALAPTGSPVAGRWFTLQEAASLVDDMLRSALDALALRVDEAGPSRRGARRAARTAPSAHATERVDTPDVT